MASRGYGFRVRRFAARPDDRRQSPRSGAIDYAADAFFGFLKNSFQDQRMKNDKYVLEHILRQSQLHSGGGAWI
jgi:hypothetical protein